MLVNIPIKLISITALLFFLSPSIQPALYNPIEIPWFSIPATVLITVIVFVFSTTSKIHIAKITIIPLTLAIIPILVHEPHVKFIHSLFHIAFIMALVGTWAWATNTSIRNSQKLLIIYIISSFIWCLLAIAVWLGISQGDMIRIGGWALTTDISSKINGPFANGNVLGILAFCSWVVSLWFWLKQKEKFYSLWFSAMTFFGAMGIATLSRSAWIAYALVFIIVIIQLSLKNRSRIIPFIIAFSLTLPLGLMLNDSRTGDLLTKTPFQQFEQTKQEGFGVRILLWASVFEVWKQHPWQGVGYGGLGAHYLTGQHDTLEKNNSSYHGLDATSYAHNAPLHLLAEGGISGALLALFITICVMITFILNWKRMHSIAWPLAMIASMLWLQGMVNITMTRPFPILLFCFAVGASLRSFLRHRSNRSMIPKKSFIASLLLSLVILCSGAYTQTRAWDAYGTWIKVKGENKPDMELVTLLLSNDNTMPFMVAVIVREMLLIPSRHHTAPQLMPYIQTALKKRESRLLYQGLFFTQALSGEMNEACKTGRFITIQNWPQDNNQHFYEAACEGRLSQSLEIQK